MSTITREEALAARPMPLFCKELRAKVRDGTKVETRRALKPQPVLVDGFWRWQPRAGIEHVWREGRLPHESGGACMVEDCPYGAVGDVAYLREPLYAQWRFARYSDDNADVRGMLWRWKRDTLSSMHMPRAAARTFVRYTAIRAERLQDITVRSVIAEGAWFPRDITQWDNPYQDEAARLYAEPKAAWVALWDRLCGDEHPWDANDWVFAIAWEPVEGEE